MTFFSRFLPKGRGFSRRAKERRRLIVNLEGLETRTVLSNVSVQFPAPNTASSLLITGDAFNDNFTITENSNGSVTVAPGAIRNVPGVGIVPGSTINGTGSSLGFSTNNPVSSISVVLPGTNNFDFVTLSGPGSSTTVGNVSVAASAPNLTFQANSVVNNGNLVVTDTSTSNVNAVLNATITNSKFEGLSITQFGDGPDSSAVTLTGDTVLGNVYVSLGDASGDSITASNNNFGPTTFLEGNGGPSGGQNAANSDTVTVGAGSYKSLTINQMLDGTDDAISVGPGVIISPFNPASAPGIVTNQGNGAGDTTTITGVTAAHPMVPINLPLPTGIVWSSIKVTQGNGSMGLAADAVGVNDQASVTDSSLPGFISISQSDLAGNSPSYNTARISGDTAGQYLSIVQGDAGGVVLKNGTVTPGDQATIDTSKSGGYASITQGAGINDSAAITTSTIGGSASITQGDQAGNPGDQAKINGDTVSGSDTITQGDGNNDTAQVLGGTAGGSVSVTQGAGNSDTAAVSLTSIGGNASISQGAGNTDLATILGPGTSNSAGTIGGNTTITQLGGNGDTAVIAYLTIGQSIGITQGQGNGDAGEIENVTSTGGTDKAPIAISVAQGNGNGDIAAIVSLDATGGTIATPIPISTVQGSGTADFAEIATVTAPNGNISITQSDVGSTTTQVPGDTAMVLGVSVGTVDSSNTDYNGNVTISQGSAAGDVALVEGLTNGGGSLTGNANNVTISQGNNLQVYNGSTVTSDLAEINDMAVTSDITITQGTSSSATGLNVAAIAFDYYGYFNSSPTTPMVPAQFTPLVAPPIGSSSVTAGGVTSIKQSGANNQVFLGDPSNGSSFMTNFLDVYTGDGGGAFVQAANSAAFFGPLTGATTIIAADPGSTYVDAGGNTGITFSTITPPAPKVTSTLGSTSNGGSTSTTTTGGPTGGPTPTISTGGSTSTTSAGGSTSSDGLTLITTTGGSTGGSTPAGGSTSTTSAGGSTSATSAGGSISTTTGDTSSGGVAQAAGADSQLAVQVDRLHHRRVIRVFDVATGKLRFSLLPFGRFYRGNFHVHVRNVNGNGIPEIVVQAHRGHGEISTRVFSGLDGTPISTETGWMTSKVRTIRS